MSDLEPEPTKDKDLGLREDSLSPGERNIYDRVLMERRQVEQREGTGRNVSVKDRLEIIAGIKSGQIKEAPTATQPQAREEKTVRDFPTFIERSLPTGDRDPED